MEVGLERVIAQRVLERHGREVRVLIGEPRPMDGTSGDHVCPYRIEEPDDAASVTSFAVGVDSVQALMLALSKIGDTLQANHGGVTFLGRPQLGFPVTVPAVEPGTWTATATYPTIEGG
ncbi:DUF6968 family protein [Phytoactinopolyspora limicola]|uniref:DUF6968 family protein n=1 Tax=Phytoactinopolyspora limicola TaxID=2715536 RepID=UPI00140CCA25|nr:hypothetical protein [Phytoactinopolyspora limicola]